MLAVYAVLAVVMASVVAVYPNSGERSAAPVRLLSQPLTGCLMSLPGKLQMCDKPRRYQLQGDVVWTEDLQSLLAGLPRYVRLVCLSIEGVSCKVGC